MRFSTDDRVTVTDPENLYYGEQGIVEDYELGLLDGNRLYLVELDGREFLRRFTVDQLDFTNTEEGEEKGLALVLSDYRREEVK